MPPQYVKVVIKVFKAFCFLFLLVGVLDVFLFFAYSLFPYSKKKKEIDGLYIQTLLVNYLKTDIVVFVPINPFFKSIIYKTCVYTYFVTKYKLNF